MAGYEPIDLDALRNAPADLFAPAPPPGHGTRLLRGIPFDLGSEGDQPQLPGRAWLGFGDGIATDPVTIPIGRPARRLIVAHPWSTPPSPTVASSANW